MEVGIDVKEHGLSCGEVKKRAVNVDGNPTGMANRNVSLDSRAREIEFSDSQTKIPAADITAENLLAEVDTEGSRFLFMEEIEDHRRMANAIPRGEGT